METSEIKTADSTSGGYFKVSLVKISARSEEGKGRSSVAQLNALVEKPVLKKTINKLNADRKVNIRSIFEAHPGPHIRRRIP